MRVCLPNLLYISGMDKPAYFLSDAHLGIEPPGCVPDRESKLIRLLESWKGCASHVVFVGDLFEFWYEYRYYVVSKHMKLFHALSDLVKSGTEVHLLEGNHDFAYGRFFPEELGVKVHKELVLEIQGRRVYFRHGDGVASSDYGYRFLRRVLDFPLNRWLFSQIHPDRGMAIARFVGRNSRKYGEDREIRLDQYLKWADCVMDKTSCDFCIHGHHHLAGIWEMEHGVAASAGEWIKRPAFLKMEKGGLSLISL